jgi:uncharacterized protein (TIGR02679 family)
VTGANVPPNVQRAIDFFARPGLTRLLTKLREKYIERGSVSGQVVLEDSTVDERREIASFLSKPTYQKNDIKIRLLDIDNALRNSGFACALPEVLAGSSPSPLITRPERHVARQIYQGDFYVALQSIVKQFSSGSHALTWLEQGPHGVAWLFSRHKNASPEKQQQQLEIIRYIASILERLPGTGTPQRLAVFSNETSGDPHALDPNRPAGRLLLLALHDLSAAPSMQPPQSRAEEVRLYNNVGLLIDTISSHVAVSNLGGATFVDGKPDPLLQVAGQRVLLLPLRQLLAWRSARPAATITYVIENPQVFEEVVASMSMETSSATYICTAGWPSVAALTLLDMLLAASSSSQYYYNGDFDLKGLQIAAYLLARYPGRCHPWHLNPQAYTVALRTDGVSARATELAQLSTLPAIFAPLVASIQEKKKWAYQEGITQLLVDDLSSASQSPAAMPCAE